jgi:hypothetical protein
VKHMKRNIVVALSLCLSPLFAGDKVDVCTPATAAGHYTVTCTGWTSVNGAPLTPIHQVGIVTGDSDGTFTGFTAINIGGQVIIGKAPVSGKATINPDCTGQITYNKGTPGELNITFVINPLTKETSGMIIDKGSVVSCTLKSMTK